ncbi:sugar transferase [Tianweitania sp. Rool2]|uniref:Sugar transferase n=2 Tax=Oryzicola mucosus TaxID=2767425 RepID=A0A8J6PT88_9HYPH|nr:sugar transferase [Oryzicola mucosus]
MGSEGLQAATLSNSIIASFFAVTIALYFLRRVSIYPGFNEGLYVFPTLTATYGMAILVLFAFRLDYSRFHVVASFCASLFWFLFIFLVVRRNEVYRMAVVPGGAVGTLMRIPKVEWVELVDADQPLEEFYGLTADLRANLTNEWERVIASAALGGLPVFHFRQVTEALTGRTEIEHLSENTLGSINPNQAYIKIKQVLDWVAAAVGLVVLGPLIAVLAVAIRLETTGPAFFKQERIGYRGKTFNVYKLRTMRVRTEDVSGPSGAKDVVDRLKDAMTLEADPRVTRLGRFLRRSRIDELPQLINILRGEMSWIGPRPEAIALSKWYEKELPFYVYRHIVRPGITGWAQINQGHVVEKDAVLEKLHYDFYYIKNFSYWLDVIIILKTFKTVLTGAGSR